MEQFHNAFDQVHASEAMKASTRAFLNAERQKRARRPQLWQTSLALCAALVLVVGLGAFRLLRTPVAYVSIDVNPSVELTLNRFDRVLSATAYNEDGQRVLSTLSLTGKPCTQAVELLLESQTMADYLTGPVALTVTVSAPDAAAQTALLARIQTCSAYQNHHGRGYCTDNQTVHEAHRHGMSFGKYAAYTTLSQYDSSVTMEDCQHMTMAELHARIRACQGHGTNGSQGAGHHRHGNGHD